MSEDVPILIIGGGIGGLTAALALAREGFPVRVVERSAEFGEIGAGIQLAPNALRILDGLGVLPDLAALGVRPRHLVLIHADTGRHLTTVDFGETFQRRYGYAYTVMHRGDLLTVLHQACQADNRITLEASREVTALADHGGAAQVRFADGSSYECGAVIGADGLWSTARRLVSDDQPRTDAYVAYRGTLPASDMALLASKGAASAGPEDEVIWIGPHRHLVRYPIRPGELYNQVAVFRSWQYSPQAEAEAEAGLADRWGTPEELDDSFAGSCEQVRAGVALISRDRRWVMYDREPLDNWTTGRITLLGDAAHPMVQYLAQGACQAIEDAGCLARHLTRYDGDAVKAFAAYQAERIPRTALIQRSARIWGQIWHDDGPVIPLLRDRILTRRSRDDYTDLDWLYQDQPEASLAMTTTQETLDDQHHRQGITRRSLLAGASASTAAGAAFALLPASANAAAARIRGNYRIDMHAHFLPAAFGDILRSHGFFYVPQWTPELHIDFMDAWRIQAGVVSASLYFDFGDPNETAATARLLNNAGRSLLDRYSDRFGVTVSLPLPYVDLAITELNYALDTLNLDNGVMLFAQYNGVYLGDPSYDALYQALNERGSVVWVHPAFALKFPGSSVPPWNPASPFSGQVLEYPFETTRAAANIIYHGLLARFPNIRWQLSHSGGTLPFTLYRLALMQTLPGNEVSGSPVPGPFASAKRFYYDTAVSGTPAELAATKATSETSRIVFGTDWPFTASLFAADAAQKYPWFAGLLPRDGDPEPALSNVFTSSERMSVDRDTALKLYPSLAARIPAQHQPEAS